MKRDKKERILKRFPHGIITCEESKLSAFAKEIGTTKKYIKDTLRTCEKTFNGSYPALTIENYLMAALNGQTKQENLAFYFGVSRSTITRFEKETKIRERLKNYFGLWKPDGELKESVNILHDVKKKMEALADDYKQAERNMKKIERIINEIRAIK